MWWMEGYSLRQGTVILNRIFYKGLLSCSPCSVAPLDRTSMLIYGLGCGFQNEATITASIQMPLNLSFHARRVLPFQVPAYQMDGIPTGHLSPAFSGPALVGPFSSGTGCDKT